LNVFHDHVSSGHEDAIGRFRIGAFGQCRLRSPGSGTRERAVHRVTPKRPRQRASPKRNAGSARICGGSAYSQAFHQGNTGIGSSVTEGTFSVMTSFFDGELVVSRGPGAGTVFPLTGDRTTIGSGGECGVRLTDPSLESRHAQIELRES